MKYHLLFVHIFHWSCTVVHMVQFLSEAWCPNFCVAIVWPTWRNVRSKELWGVLIQELLENHHGQFPCFGHCVCILSYSCSVSGMYSMFVDQMNDCIGLTKERFLEGKGMNNRLALSWQSLSWKLSNVKVNHIFEPFQPPVTTFPITPPQSPELSMVQWGQLAISQNMTETWVFDLNVFAEPGF